MKTFHEWLEERELNEDNGPLSALFGANIPTHPAIDVVDNAVKELQRVKDKGDDAAINQAIIDIAKKINTLWPGEKKAAGREEAINRIRKRFKPWFRRTDPDMVRLLDALEAQVLEYPVAFPHAPAAGGKEGIPYALSGLT